MPIIGDEMLESLAQFLGHEDPQMKLIDDGISVRGADVWRTWELTATETRQVMVRVTELRSGSRHPR